MTKRVLVTGGAGFIGSHIVDALLAGGYQVRVLDNLDPQVHGPYCDRPDYLNPEAELMVGDVRDREAATRALEGCEAVFHEAAAVGVGQSMYEIERYSHNNVCGTANLLEALVTTRNRVEKLVVASSMSAYGEGKYRCLDCGPVHPDLRPEPQLLAGQWEMRCPACGQELRAAPTDESTPLAPTSIYAINKRDQEEMCLSVGRAYRIPTVALRYFNVYGPRQALSNPYTGVAAIFSARILNDSRPLIFEDGRQVRDFVHVTDVARANLLVLEKREADYRVFNVGTGRNLSLLEFTAMLLETLGRPDLKPEITGRFRTGDVRHCYADISAIREIGYRPQIAIEHGIIDLVTWVREQCGVADHVGDAVEQLASRGLIK